MDQWTQLVNEDKQILSFLYATLHVDLFYNPIKYHYRVMFQKRKGSKTMDQGTLYENKYKQSCHSCTRHSVLACSIILQVALKYF